MRHAATGVDPGNPQVVIAHDFTEAYGGAERIVATLASAYPDAELFSLLGRASVADRMGVEGRLTTILPQWEPLLRRYRWLAPIYPAIARFRTLPACDVLLTSSYAFAHGFSTENHAPQVCYCHSPLRFAWSMTSEYGETLGSRNAGPRALGVMSSAFRALDRQAAKRVSRYLVASRYVAEQVERFYGVSAAVVGAPIDTDLFRPTGRVPTGDYFLFCARLVEPYKRPALVIDAFRSLPHLKLIVAGDGPEFARLKGTAPDNVRFVGHQSDPELVPLMEGCRAAIFPSRDDFGLIPLEVMACGRPVLAFAGGGALETVIPGTTGELFGAQDVATLVDALEGFEPSDYDPATVRRHAEQWSPARFLKLVSGAVRDAAEGG